MFRFLARLIGLVLVAAGFVGIVIDGTRSVANGVLSFTPLGELAYELFPASVLGVVLGLVLLWLGQRPVEAIGYAAGP